MRSWKTWFLGCALSAALALPASASYEVVAFGDSITQGGQCKCDPYPARLPALTGRTVVNCGVGGSTATRNVDRARTCIGQHRPKFMVILYGINDIHQGHSIAQITDAIGKMVSICQASNVTPVLATYPPQCGGTYGVFAGKTRQLNAQLRSMASSKGLQCVDLEGPIGGQSKYYERDGLHPNDAGTKIVAQEVARVFWAHWPLKYAVTLDANGGSNGTAKVTATYGKAMPSATAPKRFGYSLLGLYTTATGGTQYYTSAMKSARAWDKKAATTLYARWSAKKSKITFNANGGKLSTTNVTATFGKAMPSAKAPTRTGYKFLGYYNAKTGGTCFYDASMAPMHETWKWTAANYTFHAHWEARKYTVTFDMHGGSNGTDKATATYGKAMPAATAPVRRGCTFLGYYDAASGGTQYYTAAMKSARTWNHGSVTLYAHWKANGYTVTLSRNGGSNGTAKGTATYGTAMPTAKAPSRQYYAFQGYYDAKSGGTQYYTAAMKSVRNWNKAAATTLYARWLGQAATVTIKGNGGSNGTAKATARYGAAMPAVTMPVRKGYRCLGIFNKAAGGARYWNADGSSARAWNGTKTAYTFYAQWERLPQVVGALASDGTDGTPAADGDPATVWHGAADRTAWTLALTYDLPMSMSNLDLDAETPSSEAWGAWVAVDSAAVDAGDWMELDLGAMPFDEPLAFQYLLLWFEDVSGVPPAVREVLVE